MNTKDLITNPEFVNNIADSLEDFPQGSLATYDLWVVGYNLDDEPVSELFIYTFDNPEEALNKAESIDTKFIEEQAEMSFADYCNSNNLEYVTVEVETIIEDVNEASAGTIYKRELWVDGEYGDIEAVGLGDYDNVVCIANKDFEILEDGTLKVNCGLLRDFNKNDLVLFEFVEENPPAVLEYKIMSKVVYKDGDYYHCELTI